MKRRRNITSDSDIRFKTTIDEKNALQVYCFRNNISVSELIRQAVNEKIGQIFTLNDKP